MEKISPLLNQAPKGNFIRGTLFAFLLALLCPTVAKADSITIKDTDYPIPAGATFVSPDGDDANDGTQERPWRTLRKAISATPDGGSIVMYGGTYRGADNAGLSINKKLTIQPMPDQQVWIKGSLELRPEDFVQDGTTYRYDGWTYELPTAIQLGAGCAPDKPDCMLDPRYPMANYLDMVYLDGVSLRQVATLAEVVEGTFYVNHAEDKLYIGNNPAEKTVEATAFRSGIDLNYGAADSLITGIGFAHHAINSLYIKVPRVTVEDSTIIWNGIQGARVSGADAVIRGNTFSYNGRKGLGGNGNRLLLEDNLISYNNVENFQKKWDAAGIKMTRAEGVIWNNNIVEDNNATGMWLDDKISNATVTKNNVRRNKGTGIYFEISDGAIIAGNIVEKNGIGIAVSGSPNVQVYNNTLVSNNINISVSHYNRVNEGTVMKTSNVVIKNNLLSNPGSKHVNTSSPCSDRTPMIAAMDHNGYYRTTAGTNIAVTWSPAPTSCREDYETIEAFNSATGLELPVFSIDNDPNNPFFVDEAAGNFCLKPESPSIGFGEALPVDVARTLGLEPGVPVSLGAIQADSVAETGDALVNALSVDCQ